MDEQKVEVFDVTAMFGEVFVFLLGTGVRRLEGTFERCGVQYAWKAYRIDHPAGPPTIRIDIKEKI